MHMYNHKVVWLPTSKGYLYPLKYEIIQNGAQIGT